MEHVNNDMDDLFRKAGDHFPLKTSGSDWDAVLEKLRESDSGVQGSIPIAAGRNKKRRWALLLLLIPVALGSVMYFSPAHQKQNTIPANPSQNKTPQLTDKEAVKAGNGKTVQQDMNASDKQGANASDQNKPVTHQKTNAEYPSVPLRAGKHSNRLNAAGVANDRSVGSDKTLSNRSGTEASASVKKQSATVAASENKKQTPEAVPSAAVNKDGNAGITAPSMAVAGTVAIPAAAQSQSSGTAEGGQRGKLATDSLTKKETAKDSLSNAAVIKKADAIVIKGFYFGLIAGPDWTSVKMQSVNQTGYSLGVLAGYRFNKRISLESGFYWDKKYYYSTGEYFNTKNLPVQYPPALPNKSVEGYCNMFEIPVSLRYDFGTRINHGFFAKVGFSTYIMKKEEYSFTKTNDVVKGPYPYYNTTNDFMAILQLGGGYERVIGTKTKIRVEPYIKIPLQGIGIGSMPIASAGIYFGITYSLK